MHNDIRVRLSPEQIIEESQARQNDSIIEAMRRHALRELERGERKRLWWAVTAGLVLIVLVTFAFWYLLH